MEAWGWGTLEWLAALFVIIAIIRAVRYALRTIAQAHEETQDMRRQEFEYGAYPVFHEDRGK